MTVAGVFFSKRCMTDEFIIQPRAIFSYRRRSEG